MVSSLGSLFALSCAIMLVDGRNIILNNNGCPISPLEEKLLPHENCNQFYQCVNGRLVTRSCPEGLLYNENMLSCDWPHNVICKYTLYSTVDTKYVKNNYHKTTSNSNPTDASLICAASNLHNDTVAHEICNKFYKCSGGLPVSFDCPSGLLYNFEEKICDWPDNVVCGERLILENDPSEGSGNDHDDSSNYEPSENIGPGNYDPSLAPKICAGHNSDGILVAHEKCNHFYTCSNGHPERLTCPSKLFFNPKMNICDWLDNVDCGQRIIPDENDLTLNIKDSFKKDSDNSYSSQASVSCAKEETDKVAHEKCNHFYACAHGKPVAFKCAAKLFYNPEEQKCDWPENVDCGNRIIPDEKDDEEKEDNVKEDDHKEHEGHSDPSKAPYICAEEKSNGILIAHEKCNYFYMCDHGQPMAMSCPEHLMYNPEKGKCDWSSEVKCNKKIVS